MTDADIASEAVEQEAKGAKKSKEPEVSNADILAAIRGLADRVEVLESRPDPATAPGQLPIARTPADILKGMRKGETRQGTEYFGPPGRRQRFLPNDIVELQDISIDPESPSKYQMMVSKCRVDRKPKYTNGEPIYGVVVSLMYHRRKTGEPKYKVDFGQGAGEDGVMESELELVQRGTS